MSNTLSTGWVKNVYNLFLTRKSGWKQGEAPSTTTHQVPVKTIHTWDKLVFFPSFIPQYIPTISTTTNAIFNLLIANFYPLSTVPIINPKKENEER